MTHTTKELIDFCLEKKKTCERLNIKDHISIYDDLAQCLVALSYYQVAEENEKVKIK